MAETPDCRCVARLPVPRELRGPDHEPLWVHLYVSPIGAPLHSANVADGVPSPGR
jgi:hypothetical protein